MKKLIEIEGELKQKGSLAHTLNLMAAEEGKSLARLISDVLKKHAKKRMVDA